MDVKPAYSESESNRILQLEPEQLKAKPKPLKDGTCKVFRNSRVPADAYSVVKVILPDSAVPGTKVIIECDPDATNLVFPDQRLKRGPSG